VHVASVVANLLSRAVQTFHGAYSNESRRNEMLAAGCAVGVACTFSSPVGGSFFSFILVIIIIFRCVVLD
jgi:chloride channel 2